MQVFQTPGYRPNNQTTLSRNSELLRQLQLCFPRRLTHKGLISRGHDGGRCASRRSMASYLLSTKDQSPVSCACSTRACVLGAQPENRNIASMLIVQILFLHMAKNLLPHPADRPDVGEAVNDKLQIFMVPPATDSVDAVSAARRSWGPSGGLPWLLGGSEDRCFASAVFVTIAWRASFTGPQWLPVYLTSRHSFVCARAHFTRVSYGL